MRTVILYLWQFGKKEQQNDLPRVGRLKKSGHMYIVELAGPIGLTRTS